MKPPTMLTKETAHAGCGWPRRSFVAPVPVPATRAPNLPRSLQRLKRRDSAFTDLLNKAQKYIVCFARCTTCCVARRESTESPAGATEGPSHQSGQNVRFWHRVSLFNRRGIHARPVWGVFGTPGCRPARPQRNPRHSAVTFSRSAAPRSTLRPTPAGTPRRT
jgi:hypothetical protein